MRWLVVVTAVLMPAVSYLSQTGWLGPTNGEVSGRYPTLLVAAGYAFSIWGLIFLGDLVYAVLQATGARRTDEALGKAAPWAAAGFFLTGIWSPLFTLELFEVCLAVIVGALVATLGGAIVLTRAGAERISRGALGLHAGWLSLAAFLNLAQVIVARRWLSPDDMLGWSLPLIAGVAVLLFAANRALRGSLTYAAAAIWGLVAVFVKQREWSLPGSDVAAWCAVGIAVALAAQTWWLMARERRFTA